MLHSIFITVVHIITYSAQWILSVYINILLIRVIGSIFYKNQSISVNPNLFEQLFYGACSFSDQALRYIRPLTIQIKYFDISVLILIMLCYIVQRILSLI